MLINITIGNISKTIKVEDDPKLWEQLEIGNDVYECNINLSIQRRGNEVTNFRLWDAK